jgi:SRSO17 transposase
VPAEIRFLTKPEIALEQITAAVEQGVPAGVVLADAGYGNDSKFREGLAALGVEDICHRLPANPDPSFLT